MNKNMKKGIIITLSLHILILVLCTLSIKIEFNDSIMYILGFFIIISFFYGLIGFLASIGIFILLIILMIKKQFSRFIIVLIIYLIASIYLSYQIQEFWLKIIPIF